MATENTITKQLATYIAVTGAFGELRKNVFIRHMPDQPDKCIAVIPTGGFEPDHYLPLRNPTFQILVREEAGKEDKAEDRAYDISQFLQSKGNFTFVSGGKTIHFVTALQEPSFLEYDENERPVFVFNVRVNYVGEPYSNI